VSMAIADLRVGSCVAGTATGRAKPPGSCPGGNGSRRGFFVYFIADLLVVVL
jgi:hypothetical protein